jgi:hypothetical protein
MGEASYGNGHARVANPWKWYATRNSHVAIGSQLMAPNRSYAVISKASDLHPEIARTFLKVMKV